MMRYVKPIATACILILWLGSFCYNRNLSQYYDNLGKVKEFIFISITPREHPHGGALDAEGKPGYVAPVTAYREKVLKQISMTDGATEMNHLPLNDEEFELACNVAPGEGFEKKMGYDLLISRYRVDGYDPIEHTRNETEFQYKKTSPIPPKLLCAIYTHEKNHPKIEEIIKVWGWRCDGFFAASTVTNETIGLVNLTHLGPESYNNMWQKTRSMFAYMYDNYYDDFDFFWIGGDDVYMIVENMRNYLWKLLDSIGKERQKTDFLYLGHVIPRNGGTYAGGGPGYVINKVALKRVITEVFPVCENVTEVSAEDRYFGGCLHKILGISVNDTVDEEGRQIFTGMDPNYMATFDGRSGYFKRIYNFWGQKYGYKTRKDLVSNQAATIHLIRPLFVQQRIHSILYRTCPKGTLIGDVLTKEGINAHIASLNQRQFVSYIPSKWEQVWTDNFEEWEKDGTTCHHILNEQKKNLHDMLSFLCTSRFDPPYDNWCIINDGYFQLYYNLKSERNIPFDSSMIRFIRPSEIPREATFQTPHKAVIPTKAQEHIFSKFIFFNQLTGKEHEEYIEPLVAHLGFPLAKCLDPKPECFDPKGCLDSFHGFIVPPPPSTQNNLKSYIFDGKAPAWNEGENGPSLSYFTTVWERHSRTFDEIHAFENVAEDVFEKSVPYEWKDKTKYKKAEFSWKENLGNAKTLSFDFIPSLIKDNTKEEDYVLLKLDMDVGVEKVMVDRFLQRRRNTGEVNYIDEIFVNHHALTRSSETTALSYKYLSQLRSKGIRAHSWV